MPPLDPELLQRLRRIEHGYDKLLAIEDKVRSIEDDLHSRVRRLEDRVKRLENLLVGRTHT